MKNYEALKQIIADMEADTKKFYEGNNSAGTRVRKQLQDLKKACNTMREDIQIIRSERKDA